VLFRHVPMLGEVKPTPYRTRQTTALEILSEAPKRHIIIGRKAHGHERGPTQARWKSWPQQAGINLMVKILERPGGAEMSFFSREDGKVGEVQKLHVAIRARGFPKRVALWSYLLDWLTIGKNADGASRTWMYGGRGAVAEGRPKGGKRIAPKVDGSQQTRWTRREIF